jgi:integrase
MATLTQLPSGKWRAQVRRAGIYRAATFTSRREAKDWANQVENQVAHVAAGSLAPLPKGATFADLIDKYVEDIGDHTLGKNKEQVLKVLRRELGRVRLASLSAAVIRDYVDRRLEDGASGPTVAGDLSYMSAVLKWGRYARHLNLPADIALEARRGLKHRGLKTTSTKRTREPTDDELERLYEYWRTSTRVKLDMETLTKFALATGMRLGEICRLQVEDVDRAARTVVIRDRKDPRQKAGNDQVVPLLPAAWAIVEPRIKGRTEGRIFNIRPESASHTWANTCAALDIKNLHFHDLRHRACREFFRMGLDIPRVSLLTGHKTWQMLRRYTDIKPEDVHAAVAAKSGATN